MSVWSNNQDPEAADLKMGTFIEIWHDCNDQLNGSIDIVNEKSGRIDQRIRQMEVHLSIITEFLRNPDTGIPRLEDLPQIIEIRDRIKRIDLTLQEIEKKLKALGLKGSMAKYYESRSFFEDIPRDSFDQSLADL